MPDPPRHEDVRALGHNTAEKAIERATYLTLRRLWQARDFGRISIRLGSLAFDAIRQPSGDTTPWTQAGYLSLVVTPHAEALVEPVPSSNSIAILPFLYLSRHPAYAGQLGHGTCGSKADHASGA